MEEMDTAVQPSADTQAPEGGSDFENMAIPEHYADSPVGKYKTVGELTKGYGEAQKLIGAKGVIVPGEKATPEEYDKFYNSLGRPAKPDGYKLNPIDGLHQGLGVTPESEQAFKNFAYKHGLTQKQAEGIKAEYYSMGSQVLSKQDEAEATAKHEAETKLRSEWGADYSNNLAKSVSLVDKYGGEGAREAFGDLGNNPAVLKTLANIAKHFSEDTFVKGNSAQPNSDTALKLKNIMLDKKHPYWVDGPGHDEAVQEVLKMQESITPNERGATRE